MGEPVSEPAQQPRRMVRRGFVEQTFAGPPQALRDAVNALTAAGFDAREVGCPFDDPADRAKGWVVAVARDDGPEHPDVDVQAGHMARADKAAGRHDYTRRLHGVLTRLVPEDDETGE